MKAPRIKGDEAAEIFRMHAEGMSAKDIAESKPGSHSRTPSHISLFLRRHGITPNPSRRIWTADEGRRLFEEISKQPRPAYKRAARILGRTPQACYEFARRVRIGKVSL